MKQNGSSIPHNHAPFQVLLADDDSDDRFFFARILSDLHIPTRLTTVEDGEQLMNYLSQNSNSLPDIIFADLNMPRKNGLECLAQIKGNEKLKFIPIIIVSTSVHEEAADLIYNSGAHYYVRKTNLADLEKTLLHVFTLLAENKFSRPVRSQFILSSVGSLIS